MRYQLQIASRALPGREAEYDGWYEETHLGDVLALPGFISCERFERLSADGREVIELVADYAVETDDPAALLQSLFAATPTMTLTDSIDMDSVRFEFLRPTGGGRRAAPQ